MLIDWNKLYSDPIYLQKYNDINSKKTFIYDMIIGELNRISVSDELDEKQHLFLILKDNIEKYYKICIECYNFLNSYNKE